MKKIMLIVLFISRGTIFAFHADESEKSKALIKEAWHAAYEGNFAKAREQLHAAAQANNLTACLYLAKGYEQGNLVLSKDQQQANYFMQLSESLKEKRKHDFIEKEKKSIFSTDPVASEANGSRLFEMNIGHIEKKIDRKNTLTEAAQFARQNPWYAHIAEFLKKEHEAKEYHYKRNFKIPAPQDAVCTLIDRYANDTLNEQQKPFLIKGMQECKTEKVYTKILNIMTDDYSKLTLEKRWELFPFVHEWAIAHGKQTELSTAYSKYICGYKWVHLINESTLQEREHAYIRILEALPIYYRVNPEAASQSLRYILEEKMEYFYGLAFDGYSSDITLRYLACARQLNPTIFEKSTQELITNKLKDMLSLALTQTEAMKAFEGSPLALRNLVERAFERALMRGDQSTFWPPSKAFEIFIEKGALLHAQYADRIVELLPSFLQVNSFCGDSVVRLLESPLQKLRIAAFKVLTTHLTAPNSELPIFWLDSVIKKLFKANLNGLIDDQDAVATYRYFYKACKENECMAATQILWHHLAGFGDPEIRKLLSESIRDFFGLETWLNDPSLSFDVMLNSALVSAIGKGIMPNKVQFGGMREFLMCANQTGLVEKIDPVFLEHYKEKYVFDEQTPINERCQFLSDLLLSRIKKDKNWDDLAWHINVLGNSLFKEYARTILATIEPHQTYYEYFSNRRKLHEFHQQNKDFAAEPPIICSLTLNYFNAMYDRYSRKNENEIHVFVDDKLSQVQMHDGLMFGYVANDDDGHYHEQWQYRLYACDVNSGYAVWAMPITSKKKHPFVIFDDSVYCATDDNKIVMINKYTGDITGSIDCAIDGKIHYMNITPEKILVVLLKGKIFFKDLNQGWSAVHTLPDNVRGNTFQICGTKIVFKAYDHENESHSFYVLEKDGTGHTIAINGQKSIFWGPMMVASQNQFMYVQINDKNEKDFLVALDLATGQKLWHYEIPANLKCMPRFSKKEDKIFLLTSQQLLAISTEPATAGTLLWQTSNGSTDSALENNDDIMISDDDTVIFGMSTYLERNLCIFDGNTGEQPMQLYKIQSGRGRRFLGTHNGKPYIQPYSY